MFYIVIGYLPRVVAGVGGGQAVPRPAVPPLKLPLVNAQSVTPLVIELPSLIVDTCAVVRR